MVNTKKPVTARQRTNRNNKERGKAFENTMAKVLGWHRVPMSGVNAHFGWCDIRDSESKDDGFWLGECKTMKPDNPKVPVYTIEILWLEKLYKRAHQSEKMPILAFTMFADVEKFIAMPIILLEIFEELNEQHTYQHKYIHIPMIITRAHDQINYTIKYSMIMEKYKHIKSHGIMYIPVFEFGFEDEKDGSGWAFVHVEDFKRFYTNHLDLVHERYFSINTVGGKA